MRYQKTNIGHVTVGAVDLSILIEQGPTNPTEALILGLALVEKAPTPELRAMVKDRIDDVMALQFPVAFERFVKTGKRGLDENEHKAFLRICEMADEFIALHWEEPVLVVCVPSEPILA